MKTDKELQTIEGLNNKNDIESFTTIFQNYIDDRDCFAHGVLFFIYPNMEPVLRVKTKDGENKYVKYTEEVFKSNLLVYKYINGLLLEINQVLQNKIINSF